jgi:hypothetical protein
MHFDTKKLLAALIFVWPSTACLAHGVNAGTTASTHKAIANLKQQFLSLKRELMAQSTSLQAGIATFPGCWKGHTAPHCAPFVGKVTFAKAFTQSPIVVVTPYKPNKQQNHHGRTWALTIIKVTNRSFTFRATSYGKYKPLLGWDYPLSVQYIAYSAG